MIEFYISETDGYKTPYARTRDKKYEALATFLTVDADSLGEAERYMTAVEAVQTGKEHLWEEYGHLYLVTITPEQVTLDTSLTMGHPTPEDFAVYPLNEFATTLKSWMDFLRENGIRW